MATVDQRPALGSSEFAMIKAKETQIGLKYASAVNRKLNEMGFVKFMY